MARLNNSSLAADLAGYTINDISQFTQAVRNITGIRIGGVFTYNNKNRLANMMNNPSNTRYGMIGSSAGGDFIGQRYSVETRLLPNKEFLDSVGGLEGYTNGGYITTNNPYVQGNMYEATEHQQIDLKEKQLRYDGYIGEQYTVYDEAIPYVGTSGNEAADDLNKLGPFYKNAYENDDLNILPKITVESGVATRILKTNDEIKKYSKEGKYLGKTFDSFGESNNILEDRYINGEENPIKNGYSISNKFTVPDADTVDRVLKSENKWSSNYNLYNEDNKLNGTKKEDTNNNRITGHNIREISRDFSLNEDSTSIKQTLLHKTNELFKDGKINSLINRFHTSTNAYSDNGPSQIQSAVLSKYGLSRGRNLLKEVPDSSYGYDNPYCRVWTSHYQYAKFKDLIRHKGFSEKDSMYNFGVLRPNNAMKRLNDFSSLQENGLARIAPKSADEVKKCMFSIENLAWKDILRDSWVDAAGEEHGHVLSKEQRGPNGGRIMWFPPYNLKVNENVAVNWNTNNFIGRGEPIYTYTNTERTGTLSFTILVDHPSIIDNFVNGKEGKVVSAANEQKLLRFFAGCDDGITEGEINIGVDTKKNFAVNNEDVPKTTPKPEDVNFDVKLRYFVFFPNDFSGVDYYKNDDIQTPLNYLLSGQEFGGNGYEMVENNPITGCVNSIYIKGGLTRDNTEAYWYYEVDSDKKEEKLYPGNYKDTASFGLNSSDTFEVLIDEDSKVRNTLHIEDKELPYTHTLEALIKDSPKFNNLSLFYPDMNGTIQDNEFEMKCYVRGYASSHGYKEKNLGKDGLAIRRAEFLKKYLETLNFTDSNNILITDDGVINVPEDNRDVSSLDAKLGRCAEVIIGLVKKNVTPSVDAKSENSVVSEENREQTKQITDKEPNIASASTIIEKQEVAQYDDEYRYFKEIDDSNDLIRRNLIEKVQYFDPAFHSITPEGFNARLTFLHQCTRQGPTVSASDLKGNSPMGAGNLAFGRPPVCILRIGDFYFTKIIIDSLSIDYDSSGGMSWDLNPEGIGIQPMLANITLGIKFLGGSDLSGPIARLQDAVSFNFFANASAYDRRADYRNDAISENDDTAQSWNPTMVNQEENKKKNNNYSTTTHTPFSTIKK